MYPDENYEYKPETVLYPWPVSILHPDLRYPILNAKQLKICNHLLARPHVTPNSSKTRSMFDQHLSSFISASRAQNLATSTARTSSPNLPTTIFSVPRIPRRQQQQAQESEQANKSSILLADECSSPSNQMDIKHADR